MKFLQKFYVAIVFLILYAPIFVLIVFSFNEAGTLTEYTGLSLEWYSELFHDEVAFESLLNSLKLAVASSLLATIIGTFACLGLDRMRSRFLRRSIETVTNIPMMNPDIVTGVSMMLLFVFVAGLCGSGTILGFGTMLIAHTTFNIPYVILSVMPRYKQMDRSLRAAAMDLGCTPTQVFFKVEVPIIMPGILSGLLLGFTLSLDDFVISHFVSSPDFQTLPLYIYNQTVHDVKFSMYALCALIIFIVLAVLLVVNFAGSFGDRKEKKVKREAVIV